MILDTLGLYSDDQDLTATANSASHIDHGLFNTTARQIGKGRPIRLVIMVHTTALSGGATTLDVDLQTDTVTGFGSPTSLQKILAIPKASLVPGYRVSISFLPQSGLEQFTRLVYTVNTANFTANSCVLTAGLMYDDQSNNL